jgi:Domain of unknown function (DUF4411)
MASRNYCIDASSLLKMKEDFPRKVFPALWDRMEELIRDGRLFAPEEVFKEIESDDEISAWVVQKKAMFKKIDGHIWTLASEIANRYPPIAKPGKFGPAADPFVIALARAENTKERNGLFDEKCECVVVTEEGGGGRKDSGCVCGVPCNLYQPRPASQRRGMGF